MNKITLFLLGLLSTISISAADYETERVALRDSILRQVTGATLVQEEMLLSDFGGKGDSLTDCYPAFVKAMKEVKRRGKGKIVLTEGTWICKGPVHLVDNVTLVIRKGATLKFVADPKNFLPMVETSWEGTFLWNYSGQGEIPVFSQIS